ncbi:MAG: D-glycero-alpha-D-manno-heptose-1,7-bisphosphate 7-phosphatase [Lentisphaerae bacterium ADurb.BinA184]|nr:MAG: D-glycero-alpha-D-manno-heptose-1,7-bisphosphate 7-phosphatase [Lentisphaerae bacterium ADurb.BinA184]
MNRAVFVDRDGTVIPDRGYLATAEGVELLPGAGEGLAALAAAGFALILVTNQSGVGRGYFGVEEVVRQHARLAELLAPFGVRWAAVRVCPHRPEEDCDCRKPRPGMLVSAAAELGVGLADSYMIGDKESDIAAGLAAGCRAVSVGPAPLPGAHLHAADLHAAAEAILREA